MVSDNAYNLTAADDNFEKTFLIFGDGKAGHSHDVSSLSWFLKETAQLKMLSAYKRWCQKMHKN